MLSALLAVLALGTGSGLCAQQQRWDASRLLSAEEEMFVLADLDFDRAWRFAERYGSDCPQDQQAYCRILRDILLGLHAGFLPRTDQGAKVRAYFASALRESSRAGFADLHARAAMSMAREFAIIHHLDSSLVLLNDAKEILSGRNEPLLLAELEKVYGITYAMAQDKDKAQEHYRSGLDGLDKLPKTIAVQRSRARLLHNLGFLHYHNRDYPRAVQELEAALEIRKEYGFELEKPMSIAQLASALALSGQSDRADNLFVEAERLSRTRGHDNFRLAILGLYVDFIYKTGQVAKALSLAREIERVARQSHLLNMVEMSIRQQARYCASLGRHAEAFRLQRRASLMNDSLHNAKMALDLAKIEARFRELSDARTKDTLRHQLSERGFFLRMLTVGAVGTVLLLIALAVFLSTRLRSNRLLRRRAKQLELANADKNRLFSMLAHDLRAPLYALYDLLEKKKRVDPISSVELEADMWRLQQKVGDTRHLLDSFLLWAAKVSNDSELRAVPTELGGLVEEEIAAMTEEARLQGVLLVRQVGDRPVAAVDPNMIRFILRSLLAHAVRSTPSGGTVEVSLRLDPLTGRARVGVQEPGWDPSDGYLPSNDRARGNEGGSAEPSYPFGLSLAQTFLSYHGATLETRTEPDRTQLRWFELPLFNG